MNNFFSLKRTFPCPGCGAQVRLPGSWCAGVERVFRCPECRRVFKTGYKTGASLFGLALSLALVTVNLGAWLLSSLSLPLLALGIVPLWLLYGFWLRRWWLLRKCGKTK